MNKVPTKERILDSALTLFAERGYDGVGVDLIAEKAGLKGPSLYKHYKGKEDILSALVDKVGSYYEENFGSETDMGPLPQNGEELIKASMTRVNFSMHDPMIRKIRRILAMEQFRNPELAEMTTVHHLELLQKSHQMIFEKMMKAGIMKQDDARLLALEYIAPVSLLIHMYDRQPEKETEALERIEEHFRFFVKNHF